LTLKIREKGELLTLARCKSECTAEASGGKGKTANAWGETTRRCGLHNKMEVHPPQSQNCQEKCVGEEIKFKSA